MSRKKQCFEVNRQELPISCPIKGTEIWNVHPKVYIPLAEKKQTSCPYCGNYFVLKDEDNHKQN